MASYSTFSVSFVDDVSGAPLLSHVTGVNFLFQRGTLPSQGSITCKQQAIGKTVGTVRIDYVPADGGGLPVSIVMPGSLVVSGSKTIRDNGMMQLTFLDRRWRWAFGHIDGKYDAANPKTLPQLMTLLLDAMGEVGYDLSGVASTIANVEWRGDVPAECLQELCDEFGYVPLIRGSNTMKVYKVTAGTALPTQYASSIDFSVDQGALPQKVRIACGDIMYQCKFKLEAVGRDTDGTIKLIDDLSYRPPAGWGTLEAPDWPSVEGTANIDGQQVQLRDFARRSVYRMYRIKEQAHTAANFAPPGFVPGPGTFVASDITELKQLLPLVDRLNVEKQTPDGDLEPLKPVVNGSFYDDEDTYENTILNTPYPGSFSLDKQRGIVAFSQPVYRYFDDNEQDRKIEPAELRLTCCVAVTTPVGVKQYYGYDAVADPTSSGVKTIDNTELVPKVIPVYIGDTLDSTSNNFAAIDAKASAAAAAEIDNLTPQQGGSVRYGRIVALELDGLRTQISWNAQSGQVPFTEAAIAAQLRSTLPNYERIKQRSAARRTQRRDKRERRAMQGIDGQPSGIFTPIIPSETMIA